MKSINFVLPVVVFLVAIVAAFATDGGARADGGVQYFRVENSTCVDCQPANPSLECQPDIITEMCFCEGVEEPANQLQEPNGEGGCRPLWRVEN